MNPIRILWGALCAALLAQPATAETLEEALALPVASELVGARDTARWAWVENEAGKRNIRVADRDGKARAITDFTEDDGTQIYDLTFRQDGGALAWVRGGDDEYPDANLANTNSNAVAPKQQIFLTTIDGDRPIRMTIGEGHSPAFSPDGQRLAFTRKGEIWIWYAGEAQKVYAVRGEVRRLQWSPDGERLLFIDERDGYGFAALLHINHRKLSYINPGLGNAAEPIFSPDGKQIAYVRYLDPPAGAGDDTGPYWSLNVADVETGRSRQLWAPAAGPGARFYGTRSKNLFWSADNRIIFPWERSGWIHPYAIDATKGGNPHELTPGAFEVETYLLDADGRSLIYAANAGDIDRRHIWRVGLNGGSPVQLTNGKGIESYPTIGGNSLAVLATGVANPAHAAIADARLTPLGKRYALKSFVAPEQVIFQAEDGVTVHAQLFRGKGRGKKPALIYVHGGPRRQMLLGFHTSGYYSNGYITNQHFAAQGYDVLTVNYRSGTGYGLAFREAPGKGRDGATEYRDILAAGRWLAAQPDVDAKRIGIWGGSWGGYLTALALARNSDLFAAGVDFHGVHTLVRNPANNLSPNAQEAVRQLQWNSSPMAAIDSWRSPVLLIHGDDDRNVGFGQSLMLARELAARKIPFQEMAWPNERHSFFRYAAWRDSLKATDAFLNEHLMRKAP